MHTCFLYHSRQPHFCTNGARAHRRVGRRRLVGTQEPIISLITWLPLRRERARPPAHTYAQDVRPTQENMGDELRRGPLRERARFVKEVTCWTSLH
ncbi:hypothetical protein EVAR_30795_1 [Eumeta japonica]|uniref:Uncharacterized protein n=1 Tax=Eumeta variegata TaxID=151549 RepID=A0A4C1V611_EUMVA|nr:hypothetical protein EVAR_30795_1 [Eumeta japonica]